MNPRGRLNCSEQASKGLLAGVGVRELRLRAVRLWAESSKLWRRLQEIKSVAPQVGRG